MSTMVSDQMICVIALLLLPAVYHGHGYVLEPPPRSALRIKGNVTGVAGSCVGGICYCFSQGCTIGCPKCTGNVGGRCGRDQGKETLPYYARSWQGDVVGKPPFLPFKKKCGTNPWCAPGSSPITGPCGTGGGGTKFMPIRQGVPPVGFKMGDDARILKELDGPKTIWKAGSIVETQWAISANHGGGYQYRLCRKPTNYSDLTEECFQQTPVEFSGNEQYIQFCENANPSQFPPFNTNPKPFSACEDSRITIPAVDVSNGTIPAGSTWRRNPIPGCINVGFEGYCGLNNAKSSVDFMFPPPGPDAARRKWHKLLGGYGVYDGVLIPDAFIHPKKHMFQFNIVDKLVVPMVPPGEYVLGWRWDCEMSDQIWLSCSDVTITSDEEENLV